MTTRLSIDDDSMNPCGNQPLSPPIVNFSNRSPHRCTTLFNATNSAPQIDHRSHRLPSTNALLGHLIYTSHLFKLITLFVIAAVHLFYAITSQTRVTSQLIEHADEQIKWWSAIADSDSNNDMVNGKIWHLNYADLMDYQHNFWMTLAALCVSLAATCFFLVLYSSHRQQRAFISIIILSDLFAFGTIPGLLSIRFVVYRTLKQRLNYLLRNEAKLYPHSLAQLEMNMRCRFYALADDESIDSLPPDACYFRINRSFLPEELLKFLIILSFLTIAYLLVVYVIYKCIRWIVGQPSSRKYSNETTSSSANDVDCFHHRGSSKYRPLISSSNGDVHVVGSRKLDLMNAVVAESKEPSKQCNDRMSTTNSIRLNN